MPGIYVHLGSLHLDFSSKFASYLSAVSSCESNIHSSQHIEMHSAGTMERIYTMNHILRGKNNTTSMQDGALLVKRTSPVIFSSSDVTPTKRKPQTPENQETIKHPTSYVIDPSIKSNKDCNTKTFDIEESLSQSVSSVDSEDNFVVFEASDNESPKQEAAEYSTGMHYTLNSMKINEDCNSEIYNTHDNLFRLRLLSECSVDSEDSFIIFGDTGNESLKKQEAMKYPTRVRYVVDPLTKINSSYRKDCNSETYNALKDTLRPRLLSESSSADSEDSFIVFEDSDDESPKQEATEDSIYDIFDSSTKINDDHCKNYNNKRYMHEDLVQFSESAEDTDDSFCIVFNTELEQNCAIDNFSYIKTNISTSMQDNSIEDETMIENDEDSEESIVQTKKVSFAPTPIIHIMVTWNYAYRAARKGQWEEMARDSERFKGRINSIAAVLNPILTSKHRSKVWQERFAFQE
ncbi:Protein phosphatase 1 regulatory subunit 15A [Formica fusca]